MSFSILLCYKNNLEQLQLSFQVTVEIEVPEIIVEDREYEKNKFEEYKARHGFLELDLKKEKK